MRGGSSPATEIAVGDAVKIQDAAEAILATVPMESAGELERSFGGLSPDLQAVFLHGAVHDVEGVGNASPQAVANFAIRTEGQLLIREWGSGAAAHIARFNARCSRILQTVPASRANAFVQWVLDRSPEEARAIGRVLGR